MPWFDAGHVAVRHHENEGWRGLQLKLQVGIAIKRSDDPWEEIRSALSFCSRSTLELSSKVG
jgi:hypothetical protein